MLRLTSTGERASDRSPDFFAGRVPDCRGGWIGLNCGMTRSMVCAAVVCGLMAAGCSKRQPAPESPAAQTAKPRSGAESPPSDWPPLPEAPAGAPAPGPGVLSISNQAGMAAAASGPMKVLDITPMQAGSPALPPQEAARRLARLELDYGSTQDLDRRLELLEDITKLQVPERTQSLLRLLKIETQDDLKFNMLDAVYASGGTFDEKLEVLKEGFAASQSVAVRLAAIDGLVDLADPRVLPCLKGLMDDPKPEVRDYARQIYEIMTAPARQP